MSIATWEFWGYLECFPFSRLKWGKDFISKKFKDVEKWMTSWKEVCCTISSPFPTDKFGNANTSWTRNYSAKILALYTVHPNLLNYSLESSFHGHAMRWQQKCRFFSCCGKSLGKFQRQFSLAEEILAALSGEIKDRLTLLNSGLRF